MEAQTNIANIYTSLLCVGGGKWTIKRDGRILVRGSIGIRSIAGRNYMFST